MAAHPRPVLSRRAVVALAGGLVGLGPVALLAACGGTANATVSATTVTTATSASAATTPRPVTSTAASSASTARATSPQATSTTATAATSAPASATAAPGTQAVPLRLGSWLTRPTNQAVYNDQLIKPYQQLHPNVKITVEYTTGTKVYLDKMVAETAAGDPPDILETAFDYMQGWANQKVVVDLDPLIARSKIDRNNYVQAALELGRYPQGTGKQWAWYTLLAVGVIYYNKTLFDNAGLKYPDGSWDYRTTMLEAAQKLTKKGTNQASSFWGFEIDYFTRSMLYSFGFQEVSDDGKKALVDSPGSIAAHQYWVDLINKYQVSLTSADQKALNVKEGPFETNRLAMSLDGSYETQAWQQIASLDWDIAMPPKGPAGQFSVIKGNPGHGLSPHSRHQSEGWDFLSWWILNETPEQVVNPGNLPSRLAAIKSWAAAERKAHPKPASIAQVVDIATKLGKAAQVPPRSSEVWAAYLAHRKDILAGKVGVADGLHAAAQQMDGILAQP